MLSKHLTADEIMVLFRGHCPFKVYTLKSPTKYGIKVYSLVDITLNYVFNFEIYMGQQPESWISNLPTDVIIRMIDQLGIVAGTSQWTIISHCCHCLGL